MYDNDRVEPPLVIVGLFKSSTRVLFDSLSPLFGGGGLNGRFIDVGPEPVESTGDCPADPGPTFAADVVERTGALCADGAGLTTLVLPPTLTVGLTGTCPCAFPPDARLINDSATPSS